MIEGGWQNPPIWKLLSAGQSSRRFYILTHILLVHCRLYFHLECIEKGVGKVYSSPPLSLKLIKPYLSVRLLINGSQYWVNRKKFCKIFCVFDFLYSANHFCTTSQISQKLSGIEKTLGTKVVGLKRGDLIMTLEWPRNDPKMVFWVFKFVVFFNENYFFVAGPGQPGKLFCLTKQCYPWKNYFLYRLLFQQTSVSYFEFSCLDFFFALVFLFWISVSLRMRTIVGYLHLTWRVQNTLIIRDCP